jgi:O-antigen/teichoic acid export membrane protein
VTTTEPGVPSLALNAAEVAEPVTRKVLSSTAALLLRSAWERALSLAATLAVARLVVPRELGLAALVLSITALATTVVDAGITLSFMRLPVPLTHGHFAAARKVQFAIAFVVLIVAAGSVPFSTVFGLLLVLDCLQLFTDPLVLQPKVMLARSLEFRGLATADAVGVLARSVVSLGVALAFPSAVALVLGDLCAAIVIAIGVVGVLSPRAPKPELGGNEVHARVVLREGLRFQGFAFILTFRDLTSAGLITGLVGLRALGLFQFAQRLLSPVLIVFSSLSQLAVPVGVRVHNAQAHVHRRVQQGYVISGMVTATVLAMVAAPAHWLVPALFGNQWTGAVPLVSALALALVINGPAVTFGVGLILAANRTTFATWAAAACAIFFVATLAALHSFGGLQAISIAWVTSAAVEAAIVVGACRRIFGIRLAKLTLLPIPVFALAYGAGYLAGRQAAGTLVPSVAAAATAGAVSLCLAVPFTHRPVTELLRAVRRQAPERPAPSPPREANVIPV